MDGTTRQNTLTLVPRLSESCGIRHTGENAAGQLYVLEGNAASGPVENITIPYGFSTIPAPALQESGSFLLHILHFNDLHGHLVRFQPSGDRSILSRIAGYAASLREQCRGEKDCSILTFSSGDDCGGSIFDELLQESDTGVSHLYYRLYSELGVDAACPGNHDFDRGLAFLESAVQAEACFPMLAANVASSGEYTRGIYPGAVLVVEGVRVGLIGLVTRAENRLTEEEGCILDPRPAAGNLVELMRPLCDVLIILSHLGRDLGDSSVPMEDCGDVQLARSLPEGSVDLIIGGHSHHALNQDGLDLENVVNGIPIVQAGANGEFVGQVDIEIRSGATKLHDARLIRVDDIPVDQDFEQEVLQPWKKEVYSLLSRELGVVNLEEERGENAPYRFSTGEMSIANFMTDALVERMEELGDPVDFAMLDASALQSGVSTDGILTFGDCFQMMPYHDTIRIYTITGAGLYALLEDNALRFGYHGDEEHVERGFLQFSAAVRYRIQGGRIRSQARILDAVVDGIPLVEQYDRVFTAAATCFTRELCSVWESDLDDVFRERLVSLHRFLHRETDWMLRDEITAYISKHGGITAASGARKDGRLEIMYAG